MYEVLEEIKIAVGHRGDNSHQQSFFKTGKVRLNHQRQVYVSQVHRAPPTHGDARTVEVVIVIPR